MPTKSIHPTVRGAARLLLWCCLGVAQGSLAAGAPEAPEKPPAGTPESAPPPVDERMPVYYFIGNDGQLVPVPGAWSLEDDFDPLWKLKRQLEQPDQPPRYVLQSLSAAGTATSKQAELTVRFTVRVHPGEWVRVPLKLDRAILCEPAEYKGPGEGLVQFDDGDQGYVGWIRGPAGKQHQLTLKMRVPLTSFGGETQLKLLAPQATVSQLKLKVPLANAEATVSEGAEMVGSTAAGNQATELTVVGVAGDFHLRWRKPGRPPAEPPTPLEVEATVLARLGGRGVEWEATLKARGFGARLDPFHVLLPPGASLIPGSASEAADYSVVPVEGDQRAGLPRRRVEVRPEPKKSGLIEVRLAARRPQDVNRPEQSFELAGFEVVGAARQWGHIDVAAATDWRVLWGVRRGVRQVEPLAPEDVVAGFDYDAQPYRLAARLVPRKVRLSVEPEYRLDVDASRVQLQATLKYTIRGARAFQLEVAVPPGWESVQVGPEARFAVDRVAETEAGVLSAPLRQPSTGNIELQIGAEWPIPQGTGSLVLPLPQPQVDAAGPAAVAVAPADNVELTPNHELMVGLIRQPVGPPMEVTDHRQPPLFYRGDPGEAIFAADFRVHSQRITAEVTSRVSLQKQAGEVQQQLTYTIEYEPADYLTVDVPGWLAESGELEFQYDGRPVTAVPSPGHSEGRGAPASDGEPNGAHGAGPVRMQIDLPEACIGACELVARYPLRFPQLVAGFTELGPDQPVVLPVPLVMPGEAPLSGNTLEVVASPELTVRLAQGADGAWENQAEPSQLQGGLQFATDRATERVKLEIRLEEEAGRTTVERAWVQTWLTRSAREDRAVFSLISNQEELTLVIPAGTPLERVEVQLDGQQVQRRSAKGRHLTIAPPGGTGLRRHVLELRSHCPRRQRPGHLSVELPRLGGEGHVDQMYWQLVVPKNEHLIAAPKGLTSEFTWQRAGYLWGRKPLLDEAELEAWVGLADPTDPSQNTFTPRGVNRYLFSAIGSVPQCELRTAGRAWIVLGASGAALLVGLLLIYVPACRHPAVLFVAAVALGCVGMLYPDPALLLAQAAGLGLALALLAGLLERGVARRRGIGRREPPSAVLEKASTQTHYPVPVAATPGSTQRAPVILPPSTPDANG